VKKIIYLVLLMLTVVGLSGCKKSEGLFDEKYLIVATSPDYAPYEFVDLTKEGIDRYVGADVELMKYIANKLGVELQIQEMTFDTCLMAIQTNKVDLAISGFSWTPRRAESYEMSTGYFGQGDGEQQLLILSSNSDKFKTLADLNVRKVKVAAQSGSIQEEFVDVQLPNATKQVLTDLDLAVSLLLNGTIDAVAISEHVAEVRVANNNALAVVKENFVVDAAGFVAVAKKGNEQLINKINEIIAEILEQELYTKWLDDAKALAIQLGQEIIE
jgi:polar amino acid transport system substrate-binding protein